MNRQSGVLLPIFALPGPYGCGSFGQNAYQWIDALVEGGFFVWQLLPLAMTDAHNSPYMSCSSFAGNPFFIDLDVLAAQGLVSDKELAAQRVASPYLCDHTFLARHRYPLLKQAAARVVDRTPILAFLNANPHIAQSCEFLALKEANGGSHWQNWTTHTPPQAELFAWQFIQYEFHRQWDALHAYASKKGVRIIGDIPFYVSHDSYDVYAATPQFLLDDHQISTQLAGVPPDYFCEEGQLWGTPIYNWAEMKKDGFAWWRERLSYMLTMFDGVRIDHFRAISAYWAIPAGAKSAKVGRWEKGPGKQLLDALAPLAKNKLILAENLGMIDADTEALLRYSTYPGMAVLQFGFDGDPHSPHLPHNFEKNLVAYTGTHDNNTLLGFLWESDEKTRAQMTDYLGYPTDLFAAAVRALLSSVADLVILPIQDLLGYGADTRINTPGKADGNWQYRVTEQQLASVDWQKFAHLNKIYGRI